MYYNIVTMFLQFSFIFSIYLQIAGAESLSDAYCFQFTWLGPMHDDLNKTNVNCTALKYFPCFEPFVITEDSAPPDTQDLWNNNRDNTTCPLRPGYACIKHTYVYNNAVINSTYFCGKMIEDKTSAVTSSCFMQKIDGHTIESCSCLSDRGRAPCNSTTINQYSFMFLLIMLLIMQIV